MLTRFDADKLRETRKSRNLSQMRLAELCDITDRYIRDLECGRKCNPSAAMLRRLSTVLGITMEDLIEIEMGEE